MNCPICGKEFEDIESFDWSNSEEKFIEYCCGHCPNCNKEFQWERHYSFAFETTPEES